MASEKQENEDTLDAVERDDDSLKTKLAWNILSGRGDIGVDVNGAIALLEEGVKGGDAEAMWMLGICSEFGIGVEQNIERASNLYCQSRDMGNEIGEILVKNGNEHERGRGNLKIWCK